MLTPSQIRAQVTAIRKRAANGSRAFAIHTGSAWTGPDRLEVGGVDYAVVLCHSDLHVREALLRCETEQQACILLCHFDPARLADDVLARLAKRRVFRPQAREVLAELFGARVIDSRVLACKPLVETLIHKAPKDGYQPVSGGSLDLQTAWLALLETLFAQRWDGPSLTGILGWSLDEQKLRTFRELNGDLRAAMTDWFARSRGEAAHFMLMAVEAGAGLELVPLGLLAALLFQPESRGTPEVQVALGRLERYFNHKAIDETSANAWGSAAEEFLQERAAVDRSSVRLLLTAFDRLLEQIRVSQLAKLSKFSPVGLESRFEAAGAALLGSLGANASAGLLAAISALKHVEAHFLAPEHSARVGRIKMALRLAAWLKTPDLSETPASLAALADRYLKDGGFVDWARDSLGESDPVAALRGAYEEILRQVDQRFGEFEQAFISGLQRWFADGSPGGVILPVEDVLPQVVCPMVREHSILLLILDGMSVSAFRQLLDDLLRRDWVEMSHPKIGVPKPVAAALPSITEVSRWALLVGRLGDDRRSTEQVEFARNGALLEALSGKSKPQLFEKGDLTTSGQLGLAPKVQTAILNRKNQIVAVVVNAMDDLLAAGDQVAVAWGIDTIKPLRDLLYAARDAGRLVLLTSDHGHVLDRTSSLVRSDAAEKGDRYRSPGGQLRDGEVEFKGRRIQPTMGPTGVICLTRRDLRYLSKKRGYHGGASVQEMVIPLATLRHVATPLPKEWQDLPPFQPSWWNIFRETTTEAVRPIAPPARMVEHRFDELDLFTRTAQAPTQPSPNWLEALAAAPLYREQMRRATRVPKLQDDIPRLLRILEARGGSTLRSALAQELGLPLFRIDGLVQNAGRVLNVDGYEVIAYDRAAETVTLNLELLKNQFCLG